MGKDKKILIPRPPLQLLVTWSPITNWASPPLADSWSLKHCVHVWCSLCYG